MKTLILLFAFSFSFGQIKIENEQFTFKETLFHVEEFEILDCGTTMIKCYWWNDYAKEKHPYIFFIDRQANVLSFYDVKFNQMHKEK